jgi:hypothetical protein
MGERLAVQAFSREDRQRYRAKVKSCLEIFKQMLAEDRFEVDRKLMGLELELNLCDSDGCALMINDAVLARIESTDFQTELAQFNLEVNLAPRDLGDRVLRDVEEELRTSLNHANRKACELGAHIVMVGILPTLTNVHVTVENLSNNPRYALLNESILSARGEDIDLDIDGVERLSSRSTSIAPEAAATSVQLHLQVSPSAFPALWNAAQAIAGVQVALAANSPFFLTKELWRETRIPLFQQATETRTEEFVSQGVRPRVWFGERWIDSCEELFEENVRYFPALLPMLYDEDPVESLRNGDIPHLSELKLHNGTVYRWNRPVYDVARGKPHLRVENRVLPAGPTVADVVANAAFYYGLVRVLAESDEPVSQSMSFAAAQDNFYTCARHGLDAAVYWPGVGTVPVTELVLRKLLPMAVEGLRRWGIDPADRDRFLGIIQQRCLVRQNGASWQSRVFHRLYDTGMDRHDALVGLTQRYVVHMHSNEPVHTWPVD